MTPTVSSSSATPSTTPTTTPNISPHLLRSPREKEKMVLPMQRLEHATFFINDINAKSTTSKSEGKIKINTTESDGMNEGRKEGEGEGEGELLDGEISLPFYPSSLTNFFTSLLIKAKLFFS
ncbi:hypothetical protein M1146_03580, partial [Patescibacteria group bacterium]|nr:hypothetical protein [Patescibacteria group bacterium]